MSQSGTTSPGAVSESAAAVPAPAVRGADVSGRVRRLSRRTRRRAIVLGILSGILVAVVILALDAGLSARRMFRGISVARSDLIDGGTAVVTGDPAASIPYFKAADLAADSAVAAAGHPGIRLLSGLPWIGDNIRAVRAVAVASGGTARAGLTMADAAISLGWDDLRLPGTTALGDVDLTAVATATPKFDAVAAQLDDALSRLETAGSRHLLGPVAAGFNDTLAVLTRRAALAEDASNLFHLLPRLLGGDGTRRYLLAVESLAQPQNPGGRVGPVGVMTATDGRLTLEPFAPASGALRNALVSPDFPLDARAMLAAAAEEGTRGLDGVILVDTAGLQDLLWVVGDVTVTALTDPMTQNNAVDALDRDVFLGNAPLPAEDQQATLAGGLLEAAFTRRPSTEAFATGLAEMVNGRHLALYATDRKAQGLLAGLGATGVLDTSGNFLSFALDNTGTNRTGTFVRRPVSVNVTLDDSGTAGLRVVMDVSNDAPLSPASVLLGHPFTQHPVGSFTGDASVYLPRNADRIRGETSQGGATAIEKELGVPVATAPLSLRSGDSTSVSVSARVSGAATRLGSGWVYIIRIVPQPSATPQGLRVLVKVPTGRSVTSATDGMEIAGNVARYAGAPDGAVTLFVRYA